MFNKWLNFCFTYIQSENNENKCNSLDRIVYYEVPSSRVMKFENSIMVVG